MTQNTETMQEGIGNSLLPCDYDILTVTMSEIKNVFKKRDSSILQLHNDNYSFKIFDDKTKNPITVEQMENWIDSLKKNMYGQGSPKHGYKHGRGKLVSTDGFDDKIKCHCCLGVIADLNNELSDDEWFKFSPSEVEHGSHGSSGSLFVNNDHYYYLSDMVQSLFMSINDHPHNKDGYLFIHDILKDVFLPKLKEFYLIQQS